jgi:hypothetical protein
MADSTTKPDPAAKGRAVLHEADIGSGEPSPGQAETDAMIREIPKRGEGNEETGKDGKETGDKRG